MDKTAGPAFPESYVGADSPHEGIGNGMTLRDYFAAKAMASILLNVQGQSPTDEQIALWSYEVADAMLKQRSE